MAVSLDQVDQPAQLRHRRRGNALERAILRAAWEELAAVGYRDLTMDGVAARARTSKPVLYRRWPHRAEFILAALRQERPMLSGEVPDTGSLRGDVLALLRRVSAGINEIGPETMFGLLADLYESPELVAYLQAQQAGATAMTTILEAAARRGEVRLERLTPRVVSLPIDLVRHELLQTRAPVPDAVLVEIVEEIFLPLVQV